MERKTQRQREREININRENDRLNAINKDTQFKES